MKVLKILALAIVVSTLWTACNKPVCSCEESVILSFDIVEENGDKITETPEMIPILFTDEEPRINEADNELFNVYAGQGTTFILKYDSLRQDSFKVDFTEKSTKCCPIIEGLEIRRNGELICDPCERSDEHKIVLK